MAGDDINDIIRTYAEQYGPVINAAQAAEIAHRKVQTIYDWSAQRKLDDCRAKQKGILLLSTAGFVRFLFDDR